MKSNIVAPAAILCGILLLILSFFWPSVGATSGEWNREKSERRAELVRYHHGGGAEFFPNEKASATEELEQLNASLQAAQDQPDTVATFMRWIGAGIAIVGIVVFLAQRET